MPDKSGRRYRYEQTKLLTYTLQPLEQKVVLDTYQSSQIESGELMSINLETTRDITGLSIEVWGDEGGPLNVTQDSVDLQKILREGWGLTPGEVAPVAGISPDPVGTPNDYHPFIKRYIDNTDADYLGIHGPLYIMGYTPSPYLEYAKRLKITVNNFNSTSTGFIKQLVIDRKIFL